MRNWELYNMTTRHKVLFFFRLAYLFLKGVRSGRTVWFYSDQKYKFIEGKIDYIVGCSATKDSYETTISITFKEPLYGDDPKFYITWMGEPDVFFEQIRFKKKYRLGEEVLYCHTKSEWGELPKWKRITMDKAHVERANRYNSDYIPINNCITLSPEYFLQQKIEITPEFVTPNESTQDGQR